MCDESEKRIRLKFSSGNMAVNSNLRSVFFLEIDAVLGGMLKRNNIRLSVRGSLFIAVICLIIVTAWGPRNAYANDLWQSSVIEVFGEVHEGYSVDELLIRTELRSALVAGVQGLHGERSEREILEALLRVRKQGKIEIRATRRGERADPEFLPASEIAARLICDQAQVTTDDILIDPVLRSRFHTEAKSIAPEISEYAALKGVLQLRKSRQLPPELVLKVADWNRQIRSWKLDELESNWEAVPESPGVYLFRDGTGYLYVGEAQNLRVRLRQHLSDSDRVRLQEMVIGENRDSISVETHAFAADSPARGLTVRRAYESELIRSRKPKLNLRP
jgi:hypothetical protein